MICIYHNKDLDGFCSGAIVKKAYPGAKMIGYDYGESFDVVSIPANKPVIMVDVSMPMKTMLDIAIRSRNFLWIDHHKSAIGEWDNFFEELKPLQDNIQYRTVVKENGIWCYISGSEIIMQRVAEIGISACELTWRHLFPSVEIPMAVELLGMYDTWRGFGGDYWNDLIYPFQMGMRTVCNSLDSFPMHMLEPGYEQRAIISNIVSAGVVVTKYQKHYAESICRSGAFETVFEGLNAICLNAGGLNSTALDSLYDESKHDVVILFFHQKTFWKVSIFTKKDIDVSVIAKKYGGGGHKQAAGFEVPHLGKVFINDSF